MSRPRMAGTLKTLLGAEPQEGYRRAMRAVEHAVQGALSTGHDEVCAVVVITLSVHDGAYGQLGVAGLGHFPSQDVVQLLRDTIDMIEGPDARHSSSTLEDDH